MRAAPFTVRRHRAARRVAPCRIGLSAVHFGSSLPTSPHSQAVRSVPTTASLSPCCRPNGRRCPPASRWSSRPTSRSGGRSSATRRSTSWSPRRSSGNLTLREAVARVDESRARYRVAARRAVPRSSTSTASATRNLDSENGPFFGGDEFSDFTVGVAASWELDVFGRVRRSVESAAALEEATEDDRRDVLVVLCADVAQAYVTVRTLQRRLAVRAPTWPRRSEIFELTQTRFELGPGLGPRRRAGRRRCWPARARSFRRSSCCSPSRSTG